jgi:hypothetical protein
MTGHHDAGKRADNRRGTKAPGSSEGSVGRSHHCVVAPTNAADCVSKSFYGYEHAVVAAAIALKLPWKRTHPDKQRVAAKLASAGKVTTDISALLADLDKLRKDVSYDEPGPELQGLDLEDLISGLETFLEEVERIIQDAEDA